MTQRKVMTKLVERIRTTIKKVKRPEVIEKIKIARSFGDLSENSEYDAAKDEQGFIEQRILEMEQMIRYAVIIELDEKSSTIRLGNKVTYQELPDGLTETYKIVGSAEANPFEYKISNESPVAQAFIRKRSWRYCESFITNRARRFNGYQNSSGR